jgi:protoporphyrinogen oxidase
VVLERENRVGGAAGSFDLHGIRVDFGSHRLHPSIEPEILADLQDALGDDLQKRTRRGRIRLMDRWIRFPLDAKDLLRHMPRSFVLRAARDAALGPFRRPRADTFEEVLRAGLGPEICERFYFPYARKIWGLAPGELSGEQARRRVSADSPLKIARRVLQGSGSGGDRGSAYFWYPRRGYGQISEALAERAKEAGAELRLGTEARSIATHERGVIVETGKGRVDAARLFSTIPVTVLSRLLGAPPEILDAAAALRSRSMILVYLVLDVDRYTAFDAHYLPEGFTPVTRVSEPKNYRRGDDPIGRTVLCAEIPCNRTDALWSAADEALALIVETGLADAGLPDVHPADIHVERLPFAYPIYDIGYAERFDVLDRWVSSHERVLTFGRQGLFAHDNAHHALAMAYAAVDALGADGTFDVAAWGRAREGFARHVVED